MGQGPRRALALHCTLAYGGAWAGLAREMAGRLSLIAPDMPSHGQSADWDGESPFSDTVYAAALSVMDEGPIDVIGHSFGGTTALRLAMTVPERVRSLTLIEPVLFAVAAADAPETMAENSQRGRPYLEAAEKGDHIAAAREFNALWSDGAPWEDLPERTRAAMVRAIPVVPHTQDAVYGGGEMLDPGGLDRVAMPVLILEGARATPAVRATNAGLVRRLPDASLDVIEGAGHMAPITHPSEVARAVGVLLDRS